MADSPLSEPRYAIWRPSTLRRIPVDWIALGVGATTFACTLAIFHNFGLTGQFFFAGFATKWSAGWLADRQLRDLHDDPNGGQFAATLTLKRETTYGYDEGLIAFEDGWLVFQGRRCSFSIGAGDIGFASIERNTLTLKMSVHGDAYEVRLRTKSDARFKNAAETWKAAQAGSSGSVRPPIAPHQNATTALNGLVSIVAVGAVLTMIAFAAHLFPAHSILVPVAAGFTMLGTALYVANAKADLSAISAGKPRRMTFWRRPLFERKRTVPLPDTREDGER